MQNYRDFRETTAPPVPKPDGGSSGRRLAIAGAFTGILVMGMVLRDESVDTAIIGGAALFGVAYALEAISHSPLLIARTLARIDQQTQLALHPPPVRVVEPLRLPVADPPQHPGGNFVAPVDDSDYREALGYVAQLYGADDLPDPKKIVINAQDKRQEGRLRIGSPSKPALEWLISRGVIQPIRIGGSVNGYRLNTDAAPTLFDAHALMRQRAPVLPTSGWVGREGGEGYGQ